MSRTLPSAIGVPGYDQPVVFPDSMSDDDVYAALKKLAPGPTMSPGQKFAHAMGGLIPKIKYADGSMETDQTHDAAAGQAAGAATGMLMPNPLPIAKQLLKGRISMPQLPAPIPELVEAALPDKAKKIIDILRRGRAGAPAPSNPYPEGAFAGQQWRPAGPPPATAPQALSPELQAAAEASRARVMRTAQEAAAAPQAAAPQAPPPAAAPPAPAPMLQAAAAPAPAPEPPPPPAPSIAQVPPPAPPPGQVFEMAARGRKVAELAKAIDANASAYLGVNPTDPRFGEALESLPTEWWEGMAQVAKINKPSPETVKQTLEFFRDRAAQGLRAAAQ